MGSSGVSEKTHFQEIVATGSVDTARKEKQGKGCKKLSLQCPGKRP